MTDYASLVARLRETWPLLPDSGHITAEQRKLAHDAADAIEALRKDAARWRAFRKRVIIFKSELAWSDKEVSEEWQRLTDEHIDFIATVTPQVYTFAALPPGLPENSFRMWDRAITDEKLALLAQNWRSPIDGERT